MVIIYQTAPRHNIEEGNFDTKYSDNLKCHFGIYMGVVTFQIWNMYVYQTRLGNE